VLAIAKFLVLVNSCITIRRELPLPLTEVYAYWITAER